MRLWTDGVWRDVEVQEFDVTWEPVYTSHAEQAIDWMTDGVEALERGEGAAAQALFEKCLAAEGKKPDLLNNLACSYLMQGARPSPRSCCGRFASVGLIIFSA